MPADSVTPPVLDTVLSNECERIVRRFEEAWHTGNPPDLALFLPAAGPLRRVALVELIHTDLEYRARAGTPARATTYLERFPELADDSVLRAELLSAEQRWQETEAEPPCPEHPTTAGKYELLAVVGRGSFGTVYRGHDPELRRTVAVKLFHSGGLLRLESRRRLLREARSAARLHHAHIAAVHDFGESAGRFYLVSDFIEGQTLQKVLAAGRPPLAQAVGWLADVADALHHAHHQGVVHRDVKPSNILQDTAGRVFLVDFGLARCDADETALTVEGQVLGTPAYVPPEQAGGGSHHADARSDVYSLGVILYELLTGEVPFRGTTPMVLHQVLHEEPKPPRRLDDRVPRDLETVCLKAMAKEPHHRYADAGGLADDLRRWLRGEPVRARPLGRLARAWRWYRRNPLPAGLTAVLVLVTLAGLAGVGAALARAEREKLRAQEQARRSEERMRQGQELLGAFVQASRNPLLKQRGALLARKELLDRVAGYFEKMLDPSEAASLRDERERLRPAVARERALAHTVMGQVYQGRGQPRAARDSYETALRLWQELARIVPPTVADRVGQAQAHKGLADVLKTLDRLAEAHAQARAAHALWQQVFEERPDPETEQALAECGVFVADTLADTTPAERADAWLEARRRLLTLLEREPHSVHLRKLLFHSYRAEAEFLSRASRTDLALRALERAITTQRGVLAEVPDDPLLRVDLAGAYLRRGYLQLRKGQSPADAYAEAQRLLEESLPGLERFAAVWKMHQGAKRALAHANCHLNRLYGPHQSAAARKAYQRARQLLEELRREYPTWPEYHRELVLAHLAAWQRQSRAGRTEEAAAVWTLLLDALRQLRRQADTGAGDFREVWPVLAGTFTEAMTFLGARRLEAARRAGDQAVQLGEEWLHREPASLAARRQLSESWFHRAAMERDAGNHKEALAASRKAAEHQRAVVTCSPYFDQRKYLDKIYRDQGRLERDLGLWKEAEASFGACRLLWPDRPDRLALQAADWGSLAAAVGKGKSELSAAEKAQRERYLKEAADLVRLATFRRSVAATNASAKRR